MRNSRERKKRITVTDTTAKTTTKATVKSEKVARTEKRCSLHHVNFPSENEIRGIGEFYNANSSYCKRCMLLHHKARRERILAEENREKNLYNSFVEKILSSAKVAVEFEENEESVALFVSEARKALSELRSKIAELNN